MLKFKKIGRCFEDENGSLLNHLYTTLLVGKWKWYRVATDGLKVGSKENGGLIPLGWARHKPKTVL